MTKKTDYKHEPIAVIGMECIFPKAPDMKTYWQNILNEVNAVGEPLEQWEAEHYINNGYVSTSKGGYLRDLYRFNPNEFGVMPNAVDGGEPDQFLALQVAKRALEDAGSHYLASDFDHRDTGIILGHSTYLHRGQINGGQHCIALDQTVEILKLVLPEMTKEQGEEIYQILKKQLPTFTPDTCPAMVPNVMTGRIANRLNFTGPNYLIDAACASSLLSVNAAIDELRNGTSRMMLAGGVNASLSAEVSVIFTMLDALSTKGAVTPFAANSDGTLLGEGLGVVVLKRLSDALADGDRIYSVVHGVGQSSDGKGLSLLAPSEMGESLAIRRAYQSTGIDPQTIGLIEAHGTGIGLGDKTEISSLKSVFGERLGEQGKIAVGSVKSMISHTIPAAGIASFIKMSLSLYHKILPPTLCGEVNPELEIQKTAMYINTKAKPWISKENEPCRAAINSFGFGGVNAHAILEEAPKEAKKPLKCSAWQSELFVFAGKNVDELQAQLTELETFIAHIDAASIDNIAYTLFEKAKKNSGNYRLTIIANDTKELAQKITQAKKRLAKDESPLIGKNGIIFSSQPVSGKVGFMFPGEGSQYINMLSDLAMHFEPVRQWFDFWHGIYDEVAGSSRTDIVFPVESEMTDERRAYLEKRIHDMDVGSEAVFVAGQAMNELLKHFGVKPDVMVGHSSGESSALVASRSIPWKDREQLAALVRKLNTIYNLIEEKGGIERGSLMAIALIKKEKIEQHLANTKVVIAMENCPTQTIVYGSVEEIDSLSKILIKEGAVCEKLPFDRGYHTDAFAPMKEGFVQYYKDIELGKPEVPLYSCASAGLFPKDKKAIQELAAAQWTQKVRFIETVEAMYNDGIRYFIEVGSSGKLASFAEQILRNNKQDKDCIISASNLNTKTGLYQFLNLLSILYVNDKINLNELFADREVKLLDFTNLTKEKPKGMFLDNSLPRLRATDELAKALQKIGGGVGQVQQIGAVQQEDLYPEYRPFFNEITELTATSFVGYSYLSLQADIFLQDHVISGRVSEVDPSLKGLSCVPLMVSLEIMAEACAVLAGSIDLAVIEDVKTFNWIMLDEGDVNLEVRATAIAGKNNIFHAEIFNNGKKVVSGNYGFGEQPIELNEPLEELEYNPVPYKYPGEYEAYSLGMFHGPVFQTIRLIENWNDNGIDTLLSPVSMEHFFRDGEVPNTIINPVLMDSLNQSAVFWIANHVGENFQSFPTKIERIEFYVQCPENVDGLKNKARRKQSASSSDDGMWDIECVDSVGQPLIRVKNLQNIFFMIPYEVYECRYNPLTGWLGSPVSDNGEEVQWHLPYPDKELLEKSDCLTLRLLANCILDAQELEIWAELKSFSINEKISWLFPRFCAKEAVRYWIQNQTGELLYPSDIQISQDDNGNFYADGWWCIDDYFLIDAPRISVDENGNECYISVTKFAVGEGLRQVRG